tara:strand:- start:481 stop:1086 length:606 start_codon:yes stop_codon:yes gene_type:complete
MSKLYENSESIFKNIIDLLSKAVKNRRHPYHTPVFSNTTTKNLVESRVIVLRKFDEINFLLNFHTDFRSPKILSLKKNNSSSFLFYDQNIKTQLRIKSLAKIHNQNEISKEAWQLTKLSSRKCYLAKQPPSSKTIIPTDSIPEHLMGIDPNIEESENGYKNFCVISNKIETIDWLHLSSKGHRRLLISINNNKNTYNWLIP